MREFTNKVIEPMATITGEGVTYKVYVLYGPTETVAGQYYEDPKNPKHRWEGPGVLVHTDNPGVGKYMTSYPSKDGENIPNLVEWLIKLITLADILKVDYHEQHPEVIEKPLRIEPSEPEETMLERLKKEVLEYESDTFSASGSEITEKESGEVVEKIISGWWENSIDGVKVDIALSEIRED